MKKKHEAPYVGVAVVAMLIGCVGDELKKIPLFIKGRKKQDRNALKVIKTDPLFWILQTQRLTIRSANPNAGFHGLPL